ncbi:hypothetical protein ABBQ38_005423 [Trebouxia sp. C0009 RCD-2024]
MQLHTDLARYIPFSGTCSPVPVSEGVYISLKHVISTAEIVGWFVPTQDLIRVQTPAAAIGPPYSEILLVLYTPCLSTSSS